MTTLKLLTRVKTNMKLKDASLIKSPYYNSHNPKHRRYQRIVCMYDQLRNLKKIISTMQTELESLFEITETFNSNGESND